MTEQEKKEYREDLEKLMKENSSAPLSNKGAEHAVILYDLLLSNSKTDCRFYCESAASEIWENPEFRQAFIKALERESMTIRIMTHQSSNPDFSWVPEPLRSKIISCRASNESIEIIQNNYEGINCNLSTFDDKMYRFEYDIAKYKAYGSFNKPDVVNKINALFDECFEKSQTLHS